MTSETVSTNRCWVFELLTDPERISRWLPIIRRFEPRVGGRFELGTEGWFIA